MIVAGTVLDSRYSDLVETPLPATIYTIEIDELVRGSAVSETFELPVYGGCFGDFCEGIAGVPELEIGAAYVLFLEGVGTKSQPFVGGPQGVFRIIQDGDDRHILDFFGNSLANVGDSVVSTGRASSLLQETQTAVSIVSIVGESMVVVESPPDLLYDDFFDVIHDTYLGFAFEGSEVSETFVVDLAPDSEWTWLMETSSIDYPATRDAGRYMVSGAPATQVSVDLGEGFVHE